MTRWVVRVRIVRRGEPDLEETLEVRGAGEAGARFEAVSEARRKFPGSFRVEVLSIRPEL